MARDEAPADILALAEARADARRARDWPTADALMGRILAAGWRVIDSGTMYDLHRAGPPDVAEGGVVRYGSSAGVPSRLSEMPIGVASVVIVATDWPDDLARTLNALVEHSPDGTQLVVVANGPSPAQAAALAGLDGASPGAPGIATEVVWLAERLGWATALNAGTRRASAPVVILLDTSVEPQGDLVTALAAALDDPTVAVAGPFGLVSGDLRLFEAAPEGSIDVDAIEGEALAFRRSDHVARGPLDEHFAFYRNLDVWWSLVLRDADADVEDGVVRRAVRVAGTPLVRHAHRGWSSVPDEDRDRLSKRNFYRVLKRFATRRDLLVASGGGADPT